MFTGIVEEVGKIRGVHIKDRAKRLVIECESVIKKAKVGDSVMVDGICCTIEEMLESSFVVTVIEETLRKTVANKYCPEDYVNLESALKMGDPIGGHMVQGHVDTVGSIRNIIQHGDTVLEITLKQEWMPFLVPKGSVTCHGVSLTLAEVLSDGFRVAIIPHTWDHTNLRYKKKDEGVNLEMDMHVKTCVHYLKNFVGQSPLK